MPSPLTLALTRNLTLTLEKPGPDFGPWTLDIAPTHNFTGPYGSQYDFKLRILR